jgi:hypothetical protein
MPAGVRVGNNLNAFRGGFRLWGIDEVQPLHEEGTAPKTPRRPARGAANGEWRIL